MDNEAIKWPADFSELQSMDSAFKCGICYDYMKTSMITLCSHTYCSICIRKFLQYSSKCPTCFIETHENDLRNNRPLDNIIILYLEVRNKLLRALRVAEAASRGSAAVNSAPSSTQSSQVTVSTSAVTPKSGIKSFISTPSTRTPSDKTPSAKSRLFPPDSPSTQLDDNFPEPLDCKIPSMFTASKPSSLVKTKEPVDKAQCPVCHVEIPSKNINLHLDACLDRSNTPPKLETNAKVKKRDPLPKRLYHMMNDRMLKQELKTYGLSAQGDRKTWLNRIKRFLVLYNSETDVDEPRPISALVQQLEREEREEKKKDNPLFKSLSQKVDRYSNPDAIAKANKQYIEDNKDSFKKMIEEMRARQGKNIRPTKPMNLLESDEESDGLRIVGGTGVWNPDMPSTSTAPEPEFEDQSKESVVEKFSCGNESVVESENTVCDISKDIEEREVSPDRPSSPSRSRLLSDSSVDSIFDFTPNRSAMVTSSSCKKLVKRKSKSRSPTPDPFNDTSSAYQHCLPDADLYQSVFGFDEKICENGEDVADRSPCSSRDRSPISLELGHSPIQNGEEPVTSPLRASLKRKQPSIPPVDSESIAANRPRRNIKKQKSST